VTSESIFGLLTSQVSEKKESKILMKKFTYNSQWKEAEKEDYQLMTKEYK
jgi:hypothetical protein